MRSKARSRNAACVRKIQVLVIMPLTKFHKIPALPALPRRLLLEREESEGLFSWKEKSRKSTPTSLPCADLLGSGCPCRGSNLPSLRMNFYKCASTCRLNSTYVEFLQRELVTSDMLLEICTSAALVVVQTSNLQSPGVPDGGQPLSPRPFGQLLTTKKIGKRRR